MAHARFEMMLMMVPEELAERRRRLMTSALMAATLSMGLGLLSWTADKLGISAVTPPKHAYSVTLQLLEPPPPPAAPPPLPAAAATTQDPARATHEVVPPEPDVAPIEVQPLDLDARPKVRLTMPSKVGGGSGGPAGIAGPGIPGVGGRCLLPPCIGTEIVDRPPVSQPQPPATIEPTQAPIKAVMASSIFTPDPDKQRLSRTPTGRSHRRPGNTTVSFCIDGDGKTFKVRTRSGFSGDPEVDEICRATVARWRFSPQRVGGKARTTCTSVTFDIRFE